MEQHLEESLRVWPSRFAGKHGPLRPFVERVLRGFFACGVLAKVTNRHVVLTIPRVLRPVFHRRRELLTHLAQAAAEA